MDLIISVSRALIQTSSTFNLYLWKGLELLGGATQYLLIFLHTIIIFTAALVFVRVLPS